MSDTKTFKVQEMPGGFWILENGKCVAKRKTFNDAAACALRLDYMARAKDQTKPAKLDVRAAVVCVAVLIDAAAIVTLLGFAIGVIAANL